MLRVLALIRESLPGSISRGYVLKEEDLLDLIDLAVEITHVEIILEADYVGLLPPNGVSTPQSELPIGDIIRSISDLELHEGSQHLLLRRASQI